MSSTALNELKIELRSLLISAPSGLRDDELSRDYALFNCGRSVPYRLFGHPTLAHFLDSLTDILYRSADGLIYPVVDQSTEHIFKLVQQQRSKKKKKKRKSQASVKTSVGRKGTAPHIHIAVDARKQKQMRVTSESKATRNEQSPRLERIVVTNDFLRKLLLHFHQQR